MLTLIFLLTRSLGFFVSFITIPSWQETNIRDNKIHPGHLKHFYFHNNVPLSDTVPLLVTDDYLVTDKMLEKKKIINGQTYSEEFVWFTNDTLNQTVIFELYTDYHRLSVIHIFNDKIPGGLFEKLTEASGATYPGGSIDSIENKIKSAEKISSRYFVSLKGIQLGKKKSDVINTYGPVDTIIKFKDSEMYSWDFMGDAFLSENKTAKNKPYAQNSFGYQVKMFFRNDILIAMYLHNDIP